MLCKTTQLCWLLQRSYILAFGVGVSLIIGMQGFGHGRLDYLAANSDIETVVSPKFSSPLKSISKEELMTRSSQLYKKAPVYEGSVNLEWCTKSYKFDRYNDFQSAKLPRTICQRMSVTE